jgi:tRNA dimethylallyltransferase
MITILGPTATGKTRLAANLAFSINGEVISSDSRQIYRHMDIGTGKDLDEFIVDGIQIPYHLINIADPGYEYSVFEYQTDFYNAYHKVINNGHQPILCGGSGLYIQSVLEGYKLLHVPPDQKLRNELEAKSDVQLNQILEGLTKLHNVSDTTSRKRTIRAIEIAMYNKYATVKENQYPPVQSKIFGVYFEREVIRQRITERLKHRLKNGMIEEVQSLIQSGISPEKLRYYGLEYKFVTMFLQGEISDKTMFEKLNIAIHQFAKRQMTWYRKMERDGHKIIWIDGSLSMDDKIQRILNDQY